MSNGKGLFLAVFAIALSANAVVAEAAHARSTMAKAASSSSSAKIYLLENGTPTNTTAAESFQGRFNIDY